MLDAKSERSGDRYAADESDRLAAIPHAENPDWQLTYRPLMRLARRLLVREPRGASFDTHELVQETYEKLVRQQIPLAGPEHIYRTGRLLMERLLIDRARRKRRLKRQASLTTLGSAEFEQDAGESVTAAELAFVSGALDRLRILDERQARVVELRFLVGMNAKETADLLGVTRRTVERDWLHARCWLQRELSRGSPEYMPSR